MFLFHALGTIVFASSICNSLAVLDHTAEFELAGALVAPAGYYDVRFELEWASFEERLSNVSLHVSDEFSAWKTRVLNSNGSTAVKDQRIHAMALHVGPEIDNLRDDIRGFREATGRKKHNSRAKRSWFDDVLSFLGIGSSLYVSHEVDQMEDQVTHLQKELKVSRDIDNSMKNAVSTFSHLLIDYEGDQEFQRDLLEKIGKVRSALQAATSGVFSAKQQVITPELIPHEDAFDIIARAEQDLKEDDLELVVSGLDAVYVAPSSYIATELKFTVIVHLLTAAKDRKALFQLYRAKPSVTLKGRVIHKLVPALNYIGISVVGNSHVVLDSDVLDGCVVVRSKFVCPNLDSGNLVPSACVACLWYREANCAIKACEHAWSVAHDSVLPLPQRRFALAEPTRVNVVCGPKKWQELVNTSFVIVPDNCAGQLGSLAIYRKPKTLHSSKTIVKRIAIPESGLGVADVDFGYVEEVLSSVDIAEVSPLPSMGPTLYQIVFWGGIVIAIVVVVVALGYAGYKIGMSYLDVQRARAAVQQGPGEDVPAQQAGAGGGAGQLALELIGAAEEAAVIVPP